MSAVTGNNSRVVGPRKTSETLAFWIAAVAMVGSAIATFVFVGQAAPSSSNKEDVEKAMRNIAITNGAIILFMSLLAFVYLRQYPDTRDNYILIMTHFTLFLAFLAVSIAVITKRS